MASVNKEVAVARRQLASAIQDPAGDSNGPLKTLLHINCPLNQKFEVLNFCELLKSNGKSPDSLKKLIMAMNILEKYGRHLLKAEESRSSMWRYIKYSNSIFRERVDTIQGGRAVMALMGYTENIHDGVAFPEGAQPDHLKITKLVGDILLGKCELNAYLNSAHPNPGLIEEYLDKGLLIMLKQNVDNEAKPAVTADPQPVKQPTVTAAASQGHTAETEQHNTSEEEGRTVCDICGDNSADFECEVCGRKQLCMECDKKWHKHPKRQNHSRRLLNPELVIEPTDSSTSDISSQGVRDSVSIYQTPPSMMPNQGLPQDVSMQAYTIPPKPPLYHQPGPASSLALQQYQQHSVLQKSNSSEQYYTPPQSAVDLSVQQQSPNRLINQFHHLTVENSPAHHVGVLTGPALASHQQLTGQSPYTLPSQLQQDPGVRGSMQGPHPHLRHPAGTSYSTMPSAYMFPSTIQPQGPRANPSSGYASNFIHNSPVPTPSPSGSSSTPGTPRLTPSGELVYFQGLHGPYSTYSTLPNTPGPLTSSSSSQLLPNIMAITDLNKRKSRVDVSLMTLRGDIEEWEKHLNAIILQKPNFYEDPDYIALSNKKRKHLIEIDLLEKYGQELDMKLMEGGNERMEGLPQDLLLRAAQYKSMQLDDSLLPATQIPPESIPASSMGQPQYVVSRAPVVPLYTGPSTVPSSHAFPPVELVGRQHLTAGGEMTVTSPGKLHLNIPVNNLGEPDVCALTDPSLASKANPPQSIQQQDVQQSNSPRLPNMGKISNVPPQTSSQLTAPNMRTTQSASKLTSEEEGKAITVIPKAKSTPNIARTYHWECEHCTYMNSAKDFACAMCYKTSQNPKKIEGSELTSPLESPVEPPAEPQEVEEPCEYCTYRNKKGTRVCQMCDRTQAKYLDILPANFQGDTTAPGPQEVTSQKSHTSQGALGQKIAQDQDQVMLEKIEAHRKFRESQTKSSVASQPVTNQPGTVVINESVEQGPGAIPKSKVIDSLKKKIDQYSDSSNDSFSSAKSDQGQIERSSVEVTRSEGQMSKVKQGAGKPAVIPENLNFTEAIKLISERRAMEQMSLDGHDMIRLLKTAEKAGFDVEEVELSLGKSLEAGMSPLDWLKNKWQEMVDIVVSMATEQGKTLENNDVGDLSETEAKIHLKACGGDIEEAVKLCISARQEKFKEISTSGEFNHEEILTALYQNHGNVEETIDQLNQSVLHGYMERLWANENDPAHNPLLGAVPNLMADRANSVSNSVIEHEEFQQVVMNKEVDIRRRIRMVFVEAKLKSWGRAETVINILDNDLNNQSDPLESSFADIIEAVRNCGDRKSSLVYLRQECEICFSCFPMSKMRDLGSCVCKLCQDCVKQNFEVVIRERFVRDWSCPNCSHPDLEDETRASEYFGFLQLLLQTLVDQEVMDLFDTKLRDWHLQKDPNFRWCAHCACGFIAAPGGNNLAMTCPSCKKKTCFECKRQWEDQHEGLTCEQFTQWKLDNDPEVQAQGLAKHLEENGIDCPSCKMRYSLAKGGCMHFKCPQCGHEFCSGCSQAFLQAGACRQLKSCANKGLHCHHPRDCFYYLRDNDPKQLQQLLRDNRIAFDTDPPAGQADVHACPVMEQKEYGNQKKDEPCGTDVQKGMAGLCTIHYKEYLVSLINKNKLDPVTMLSIADMNVLIKRKERNIPKREKNENEAHYRRRLMNFIRDAFPLQR